ADHGYALTPRLTIYPRYATDVGQRWLDAKVRTPVLKLHDATGLGREDAWVSGGTAAPPSGRTSSASTAVDARVIEALDGVLAGHEPGIEELVALFSARGADVAAICDAADELRLRRVGDDVTFVINRNINYTNVCTFKCRFCAFSKGPLSLNLRGDPYLLDLEEVARRVHEAEELGATEVCLQGGIHPSFDGDYYLDVLRAVREGSSRIHIHAFSALEVFEGARRSGSSLAEYLTALKEAGLKTLPGTAAEILDDDVRAVLCPDKISTAQWLEVHETAHGIGLRSNVTIMFGAVETSRSWARHLVATRELQRRTGGFTEFVPLPFVHMATPLYLRGNARKGPTFREVLLMHAVGRLAYDGLIDNVQASWVKLGAEGSRRVLQSGANDLGGTLMDENISRAAGAAHGQRMGVDELTAIVEPLGRPLRQRSTLYAAAG
ncbi:MAG TPA: 5-amino-6-(D-ribitylamino)uracil--L-tyrosine 4-hydroxyphenyl transferase CofH, partial [Acidimicrobiales bacterium]